MSKKKAIVVALLIGVLAVAAPIVATLHLAREQSIGSQMAIVDTVASDVLRRADETGEQGSQAIAKLESTPHVKPCSKSKVQLMAALAVASNELQGVGYVSNNQLSCSSLAYYGSALDIGPTDYLSATGTDVRTAVTFPLVPNKHFVILTTGHNGYSVIVDPYLVLDETVPNKNTSLGIYSYSMRNLITGRGYSDLAWLNRLGNGYQADFREGDYLVSLRRSKKYDTVTFAAIPMSSVAPILRRQAEILVPIGVFAGLAFAAAILYMARIQMELPAVLKAALRNKEFSVVYQPIVDLRTLRWVGAEVLIRWQRPGGEMVRPDIFIPVAEDTGLVHRITEQMLGIVGREAASIFERYPEFYLSVNLSAADLATQDTVRLIIGLLEATQATRGNLVVEATERGLINTGVALDLMRDFRSCGVRIAIDDFGTGYSSLAYLQTFPIDILKIDKSFIDTIGINTATSQVIFHIIEMAKSLKLQMIAEGVETEAQAQVLRDYGVEFAQGWLFARPMTFDKLIHQLDEARSVQQTV